MRFLSPYIIRLMVFAGAMMFSSCSQTSSDTTDKNQQGTPVYSYIVEAIDMINEINMKIDRGMLLKNLRAAEKKEFEDYFYELKVVLERMKRDPENEGAIDNFVVLKDRFTQLSLQEADVGQLERLRNQFQLIFDELVIIPKKKVFFAEEFETVGELGQFTQYIVSGNTSWTSAEYKEKIYAKISAYKKTEPSNAWLLSPHIDLTNITDPVFQFDQTVGFLEDWSELTVQISTDYVKGNPEDATWTELVIKNRPEIGDNWQWVTSEEVSLSEFAGETIVLGMKYTAGTSKQSTWEIDWVRLSGMFEGTVNVTPLESHEHTISGELSYHNYFDGEAVIDTNGAGHIHEIQVGDNN